MTAAPPTPTAKTVALTGGAGFVGRYVLNALLDRGARVRALDHTGRLARQMMNKPPERRACVELVAASVLDDDALPRLLDGCDAVIHLVGVIRERPGKGVTFDRLHRQAVEKLVHHAQAAGVRRLIHMSALGARPDAASEYHRTKGLGEQALRGAALDWTIFRPSVIHGPDGEFMRMLMGFCRRWLPPVLPYFGPGLLGRGEPAKLQPVYVKDVAALFVQALDREITIGKTYDVGGPDIFTWPQFYKIAAAQIGCRYPKPAAPVPAWFALAVASLNLPGVPFNRSQVIMSQEDSVCDVEPLVRDFDVALSPFEKTVTAYGKQMG